VGRLPGDHAVRRREVSAAVWRVLAERGFGGLTVRAVAAELGTSTGVVTHYFTSKAGLVRHALHLLDEQSPQRVRAPMPAGLGALRAALLGALPVDDEAVRTNRVWVSSWDPALADPVLRADHAERYARGRARLQDHIVEAQARRELRAGDPADLAAELHAFVLGLIVQALLDPPAFPAERQRALLDEHLALLTEAA
jgi:AcrR family transcriptional regulator